MEDRWGNRGGGNGGENPLQFSVSSIAFHLAAQVRPLGVTLDSSNPSPNIQTPSSVTFASQRSFESIYFLHPHCHTPDSGHSTSGPNPQIKSPKWSLLHHLPTPGPSPPSDQSELQKSDTSDCVTPPSKVSQWLLLPWIDTGLFTWFIRSHVFLSLPSFLNFSQTELLWVPQM